MPEPGREPTPEPDEFDDIVRRLDPLGLTFPETFPDSFPGEPTAEPAAIHPSQQGGEPAPEAPHDPADDPDPVDEQFYRQVPGGPAGPWHRGRALAWCGVLGSPLLLALATLTQVWLSRPVVLCAGLTFVAGAIYLISQLPEHGPSQRDWPDDGAAL